MLAVIGKSRDLVGESLWANAFGNALGNSIVGGIQQSKVDTERTKLMNKQTGAMLDQVSNSLQQSVGKTIGRQTENINQQMAVDLNNNTAEFIAAVDESTQAAVAQRDASRSQRAAQEASSIAALNAMSAANSQSISGYTTQIANRRIDAAARYDSTVNAAIAQGRASAVGGYGSSASGGFTPAQINELNSLAPRMTLSSMASNAMQSFDNYYQSKTIFDRMPYTGNTLLDVGVDIINIPTDIVNFVGVGLGAYDDAATWLDKERIIPYAYSTMGMGKAMGTTRSVMSEMGLGLKSLGRSGIVSSKFSFTSAQLDEMSNLNAHGIKAQKILVGDNGKVAVIGRSMGDLKNSSRGGEAGVVDYARQLRAQGYDTELFAGKQIKQEWFNEIDELRDLHGMDMLPDEIIHQTTFFNENIKWAQKLRQQNYTVIDIGNPNGKPNIGPFYGGEYEAIFGNASRNNVIDLRSINGY